MSNPRYPHTSCPHCVFQGRLDSEDIWTCNGTVMRRYGEGERYHSAPSVVIPKVVDLDPLWRKTRDWLKDKVIE